MQIPESRADRAARFQADIEALRGKASKAVSAEVRVAYLELAAILINTLARIEGPRRREEDAPG